MKRFTIKTKCHITGVESEYKVTFPSPRAVYRYFKRKPDELVSIRNGWGILPYQYRDDAFAICEPCVPHYKRDGWVQKVYDYTEDVLDFQY